MLFPMADGGEGTIECLRHSGIEGEIIKADFPTATNRKIPVKFFCFDKTAIIEIAQSIGIEIPVNKQLPVANRKSNTIGKQIKYLLDRGITKIIVSLGGSATNDGGIGNVTGIGGRVCLSR